MIPARSFTTKKEVQMGAWGAGLYDDDSTADLKQSISLLAKIPATGERLLEILLKQQGGDVELSEEGGPAFWLAVADQFERRGIECALAFDRALTAIDSGLDLQDLEGRGLDQRGLKKREKILSELSLRLRSPRPARSLPQKPRLPDCVLHVGQVYAFPTMAGQAMSPWFIQRDEAGFVPDGWGALLIVDQGRAFDWLPWCAIASLTVDPNRMPTLEDALQSQLLFHSQTKGATLCIPKRSHVQLMNMQLLGQLTLDPDKARQAVSKWCSVEQAIQFDWSVSTPAFSSNCRYNLPRGPKVVSLLATES